MPKSNQSELARIRIALEEIDVDGRPREALAELDQIESSIHGRAFLRPLEVLFVSGDDEYYQRMVELVHHDRLTWSSQGSLPHKIPVSLRSIALILADLYRIRAEAYARLRRYQDSVAAATVSYRLAARLDNPDAAALALANIVGVATRLSLRTVSEVLRSCVELSSDPRLQPLHESNLLIQWGQYNLSVGDAVSAISITERALNLDESISSRNRSQCLRILGRAHFFAGSIHHGLELIRTALAESLRARDSFEAVASYNNLAALYFELEDFENAEDCLRRQLDHGLIEPDTEEYNQVLLNIANIKVEQGEYDQASEILQKISRTFRKVGDLKGLALSFNNLATIALRRALYGEAIALYVQARDLELQLANEQAVQILELNLGRVYLEKGDTSEALYYAERLLALFGKGEIRVPDEGELATLVMNLYRLVPHHSWNMSLIDACLESAEEYYSDFEEGSNRTGFWSARAEFELARGRNDRSLEAYKVLDSCLDRDDKHERHVLSQLHTRQQSSREHELQEAYAGQRNVIVQDTRHQNEQILAAENHLAARSVQLQMLQQELVAKRSELIAMHAAIDSEREKHSVLAQRSDRVVAGLKGTLAPLVDQIARTLADAVNSTPEYKDDQESFDALWKMVQGVQGFLYQIGDRSISEPDSGEPRTGMHFLEDALAAVHAGHLEAYHQKNVQLKLSQQRGSLLWLVDLAMVHQVLDVFLTIALHESSPESMVSIDAVVNETAEGLFLFISVSDQSHRTNPADIQPPPLQHDNDHVGTCESAWPGTPSVEIARTVARMHGAEIECKTSGEHGATLTLVVPFYDPTIDVVHSDIVADCERILDSLKFLVHSNPKRAFDVADAMEQFWIWYASSPLTRLSERDENSTRKSEAATDSVVALPAMEHSDSDAFYFDSDVSGTAVPISTLTKIFVKVELMRAAAFHSTGRSLEQLESAKKAFDNASAIGDAALVKFARVSIVQSMIHIGHADASQELEALIQSLDVHADKSLLSSASLMGAKLAEAEGRSKEAFELAYQSKSLREEIGDVAGAATATRFICALLQLHDRHDLALEYLLELVPDLLRSGHRIAALEAQISICKAYWHLEKFDEALGVLDQATTLAREIGSSKHMLISIWHAIEINKEVGRFDQAFRELEVFEDVTKNLNDPLMTLRATLERAGLHGQKGEPELGYGLIAPNLERLTDYPTEYRFGILSSAALLTMDFSLPDRERRRLREAVLNILESSAQEAKVEQRIVLCRFLSECSFKDGSEEEALQYLLEVNSLDSIRNGELLNKERRFQNLSEEWLTSLRVGELRQKKASQEKLLQGLRESLTHSGEDEETGYGKQSQTYPITRNLQKATASFEARLTSVESSVAIRRKESLDTLALVTEELRNPLVRLHELARRLFETELAGPDRARLVEVRHTCEEMNLLIRAYSTVSRIKILGSSPHPDASGMATFVNLVQSRMPNLYADQVLVDQKSLNTDTSVFRFDFEAYCSVILCLLTFWVRSSGKDAQIVVRMLGTGVDTSPRIELVQLNRQDIGFLQQFLVASDRIYSGAPDEQDLDPLVHCVRFFVRGQMIRVSIDEGSSLALPKVVVEFVDWIRESGHRHGEK